MGEQVVHAVTGAFGYSGRSIARRLLDNGIGVRTLTNTIPAADPFEGRVPTFPLSFDRPESIVSALQGTSVLYNT
jgi:NADH dehydrogenase